MKWDLKTPCKNCPFRSDETAIRFACRERAEDIAESAYRNGFPCHLSADHHEDDEGESSGYMFGDNTQHCAGALIMHLKGGWGGTIPFDRLKDAEQDRIADRLDFDAPVWEGEGDYLDSYGEEEVEP